MRKAMRTMKVTGEMATRCELALMGKVVPVKDNSEVQTMTAYILSATGKLDSEYPTDILGQHINRYGENKVKYLVTNTVNGMKMISFLLESPEQEYPAPFEEDYGTGYPCAFCYVYNIDCTDFSELGDVFFKKMSDGYYHRAS